MDSSAAERFPVQELCEILANAAECSLLTNSVSEVAAAGQSCELQISVGSLADLVVVHVLLKSCQGMTIKGSGLAWHPCPECSSSRHLTWRINADTAIILEEEITKKHLLSNRFLTMSMCLKPRRFKVPSSTKQICFSIH